MRKFSIQIFFATILLFAITVNSACGQTPIYKQRHNVNTALDAIQKEYSLRNAGIGFYAVDVNSGEVIAQLNQDMSLAPASTMKLITSATALEILGKSFRFETKLEYRGFIDTATHVLNGDLIIRGGGDPTLGSRYFNSNQEAFLYKWAEIIQKAGIDSVNGYLIADARRYSYDMVPTTWSWEDMSNYFGAGACGLTVLDNSYALTVNTGANVGDTSKITDISPKISEMTFDCTVTADNINSDYSYIYGQPYTYARYIRGTLPVNRATYEIRGSMPDPAYYTATRFTEILNEQDINFARNPTTYRLSPQMQALDSLKHTELYTQKSVYLDALIQPLNFKSLNLVAEHLVSEIAFHETGQGSTDAGTKAVESYWKSKGIDTGGMSLNDGSGLSKYNTVTAKQMGEILKYMATKGDYDSFYNSIPTVGQEGTVKYVCKGTSAAGNMHAKSGTIRAVRAYAGYVKSASGREIAFSIMINNYNGSASGARQQMEKVMAALADFAK